MIRYLVVALALSGCAVHKKEAITCKPCPEDYAESSHCTGCPTSPTELNTCYVLGAYLICYPTIKTSLN